MNTQRKRIRSGQIDSVNLLEAISVIGMEFSDSAAVNVHGVNITLGISPGGDDEIMRGRWYVVVLPKSIEANSSLRNDWIDQLNSHAQANDAFDSTSMIWGSGSFACASNSPFQMTFNPKTSRNVAQGSIIRVIAVADGITGALDSWEASSMIVAFTSS